jgi:heme/copper-type cytochrome/quinol oxidase subunit 3
VPPPELGFGTLNTIILLASCIPNQLAKKAAEREDLAGARLWMGVCIVFAVAFIAVRGFEFTALNVKWDTNAYGSAVWFLLGLHTTHLITDFLDTVVLAVLLWTGPLERHRFVDVSENALYWWFVVLAWLPIYGVLYWAPRWM